MDKDLCEAFKDLFELRKNLDELSSLKRQKMRPDTKELYKHVLFKTKSCLHLTKYYLELKKLNEKENGFAKKV